jgi:ELWxxDGT repeat protein
MCLVVLFQFLVFDRSFLTFTFTPKPKLMKRFSLLLIILMFSSHLLSAQTKRIASFSLDQFGGPSPSIELNGKLYFSAWDSIHGRELWSTDGTAEGTTMVKDIFPGLDGSISGYFEYFSSVHNGILYFRANDGVSGEELWRSDGTDSGTYLLKDVTFGSLGSSVGEFASSGAYFYFTANTGSQLWRSDGTTVGTFSVGSFQIVRNLCGVNGQLIFSADNSNTGEEVWKYNPANGNVVLLKDLNGVVGTSLPCNFHSTGSLAFFMANTSTGWELWKSDGTAGGTVLVKDINPGANNGTMSFYSEVYTASLGDTLYFRADDGTGGGYQLWLTDGTTAGTIKLSAVPNGVDAYNPFPVSDGKVYISNFYESIYYSYDPATGVFGSTNYPSFGYFHSAGNKNIFLNGIEYYAAKDTLFGAEIWKADGLLNGVSKLQETHLVNNWTSGLTQGFNSIFGAVNDKVIFTLARNPYGAGVPLFVYDSSTPFTCPAPGVIVPVPFSNTALHLVWNRPDDAEGYEVRYSKVGTSNWTTDSVGKSFHFIAGLDSGADYRIQVRAWCSGAWTAWSDTVLYNTLFEDVDYITDILAEREEDSTVVRLYWLRSPYVSQLQFRYRPVGTTLWQYSNGVNGYKRITGLQPNTFYEYNWRENYQGSWAQWSFSSFYFATGGQLSTGISSIVELSPMLKIFPNPTAGFIELTGMDLTDVPYRIYDGVGKLVLIGRCVQNSVDVSKLAAGNFTLLVEQDGKYFSAPFIVAR